MRRPTVHAGIRQSRGVSRFALRHPRVVAQALWPWWSRHSCCCPAALSEVTIMGDFIRFVAGAVTFPVLNASANSSLNLVDNDEKAATTTTHSPAILCNCYRESGCCTQYSWPSLVIMAFMVLFFIVMMVVCCWKYCIQYHYKLPETGWLLRDAPPPPFASLEPRFSIRDQKPSPPMPPYYSTHGAPRLTSHFFFPNDKTLSGEKIHLLA